MPFARFTRACPRAAALLAAACASAAGPALHATTFRTVALTGQAAPGGSEPFVAFNNPVINASGDVAFAGFTTRTTNGNRGIYTTDNGVLGLIVKDGDAAPGTNGQATFRSISSFPKFNALGEIAFQAELNTTTGGDTGIWSTVGGTLGLVLREGDPAPGANGATFSSVSLGQFDTLALNDAGDIAYAGFSSGSSLGWWSTATGPLQLVAFSTQTTVSGSPDLVYPRPSISQNASGVIGGAVTNFLNVVPASRYYAIVRGTNAGLSVVVDSGDTAPGTGGGLFDSFSLVPINNDAGDIAYTGRLVADGSLGIPPGTDGLWTTTHGLVALEGNVAPGTNGVVFDGSFGGGAGLNAAGDAIFKGRLKGTGTNSDNNGGIWATDSGVLKLIARAGDPAPGTDDNFANSFQSVFMNGRGDIVFDALLAGEGVTNTNDHGLWFYSGDTDSLELIVREGDMFDVNPDPLVEELRQVRGAIDLAFPGSNGTNGLQGDAQESLNEAGQFTFRMEFIDGSEGVFVADPFGTVAPLPADLDDDGDVDDADFGLAFAAFTGPNSGPSSNPDADLDNDGDVDDADFGLAFASFTGPGGPAANVPEPGSLALLGAGGVLLRRRRTHG